MVARARVHRDGHPGDGTARVLDLEPVQSGGGVADVGDPQVLIEVAAELEKLHGSVSFATLKSHYKDSCGSGAPDSHIAMWFNR